MGWDGTIKPPSRRRKRIEERERGSWEKRSTTKQLCALSIPLPPGWESRWEGRGGGQERDAARGGIRNQVEGEQAQ